MMLEIRKEFTGMLQAAINKFEELINLLNELNPVIVKDMILLKEMIVSFFGDVHVK